MKEMAKWIILTLVLCAIAWMVGVSVQKLETNKSIKEKITYLPELRLFDFDSVSLNHSILEGKSIAVIYFNSECEHCSYEAQNIKETYDKFPDETLIVFMSSES